MEWSEGAYCEIGLRSLIVFERSNKEEEKLMMIEYLLLFNSQLNILLINCNKGSVIM